MPTRKHSAATQKIVSKASRATKQKTTGTKIEAGLHGKVTAALESETQNPTRATPRFYRDAQPGYGVDEITHLTHLKTQDDFKDDSDDDELISAELTEAGVAETHRENDPSRDDKIDSDREFELQKIATDEVIGTGLSDEDNDLEKMADRHPLQVEQDQ